MNSVIIREPKIDEILECVKVFLLSFDRSDFSGIFDEEQAWIYLINQKIAKFLIAEKEDKIIGVGGVFLFQQVASIGYMGVLADYRKRGIGTLLFRNLKESATRFRRFKTIILYASKLGQPIYEKFGFRGKYNASRHYLIKAKPEKQDEPNKVKIIKSTPNWVLILDRETMGFDRSDYLKARITLGAKYLILEDKGYALISNVFSKIRLGPLIAKNSDTALQIIKKGLKLGADNLIIPYHPSLQNKMSRITQFIEMKGAPNIKMVYGEEIKEKMDYLYSIGTYAKG